jgi:hypothetical protein
MCEREPIDGRFGPSDSRAPALRSPHPCRCALPDEVALKLRDAAQDVEEEPARGRARVDALIEHHEVDSEGLELPAETCEVMDATREPVELGARQNVEAPAPAIRHEPLQLPATVPGAADTVIHILADYLELARRGVLPHGVELGLDVLLGCGHAGVECDLAGRN